MIPDTYRMIEGNEISTTVGLAPAERRYLEKAWDLFESRVGWPQFQRVFQGRTSAIWFVDGYIGNGERQGAAILGSPLYRILQDMNDRLAIEQGYMRADVAGAPPAARTAEEFAGAIT